MKANLRISFKNFLFSLEPEMRALGKHVRRSGLGRQSMTLGVLALPELADGFRRLIQPLTIREQHHQFDGPKEFDRIGVWFAQWLEFSSSDEQGNVLR